MKQIAIAVLMLVIVWQAIIIHNLRIDAKVLRAESNYFKFKYECLPSACSADGTTDDTACFQKAIDCAAQLPR